MLASGDIRHYDAALLRHLAKAFWSGFNFDEPLMNGNRTAATVVLVILMAHTAIAYGAIIHAAPVYHLKDLGVLPGRSFAYAGGINDAGQVVGYSGSTGTLDSHAFLYSNGTMKDLGTLGGTYSMARAINSSGQIVGSSGTPGNAGEHAFSTATGR